MARRVSELFSSSTRVYTTCFPNGYNKLETNSKFNDNERLHHGDGVPRGHIDSSRQIPTNKALRNQNIECKLFIIGMFNSQL